MSDSSRDSEPPLPPREAVSAGNYLLDAIIGQHAADDPAVAQRAAEMALEPLWNLREEIDDAEWAEHVIGVSFMLQGCLAYLLAQERGVDVTVIVSELRDYLALAATPGGLNILREARTGTQHRMPAQPTETKLVFFLLAADQVDTNVAIDLGFANTDEFLELHGHGWVPISHALQPTNEGAWLLSVTLNRP